MPGIVFDYAGVISASARGRRGAAARDGGGAARARLAG